MVLYLLLFGYSAGNPRDSSVQLTRLFHRFLAHHWPRCLPLPAPTCPHPKTPQHAARHPSSQMRSSFCYLLTACWLDRRFHSTSWFSPTLAIPPLGCHSPSNSIPRSLTMLDFHFALFVLRFQDSSSFLVINVT